MQISSEKQRYEGLHMAQNGLHLAKQSLDKPHFGLYQVCEGCRLMLKHSDIIRDLVVVKFAKAFCCFEILSG